MTYFNIIRKASSYTCLPVTKLNVFTLAISQIADIVTYCLKKQIYRHHIKLWSMKRFTVLFFVLPACLCRRHYT